MCEGVSAWKTVLGSSWFAEVFFHEGLVSGFGGLVDDDDDEGGDGNGPHKGVESKEGVFAELTVNEIADEI